MLRLFAVACAVGLGLLGGAGQANAAVVVAIDKSAQRMTVSVDGAVRHSFPVSTGRAGYGTPNGQFRPQRLARTWFSRKYYNSPMPHSIFFHGGYAIHGSNEIRRLGGPASHGCVRLHPANAATLFALVQREGADNTRIVVSGANPTQIASRTKPRRSLEARRQRYQEPPPRAYARPLYRPAYRAQIYQDPYTGVLWQYRTNASAY